MTLPNEVPILAAIVTASASVVAAAFAHLFKLFSDFSEKRQHHIMHLMTIRNELVVNGSLAKAVQANTRTFGIRFVDRAWTSSDTSVIYRRGVPSDTILEVYSDIQLFNTLNERYDLISEKRNHEPNIDRLLAQEHAEMVALAEKIDNLIRGALSTIKT